jgi:hypothetical protein
VISEDVGKEVVIAEEAAGPKPVRLWPAFIIAGLVLYLAVYGWAEYVVRAHGEKSRLFMIATAPLKAYDFVILGASHAMPLGFADMNEKIEKATDSKVINLSVEGGGIVPNRFMFDYFAAGHETKAVVYILDSFVFYSKQWNEERINDPKLMKRALFDPRLGMMLWDSPARELVPGYLSGFYKINNPDRFERDIPDNELKNFDRVYRSNANIDRQRLAYLYPKVIDTSVVENYLGKFDEFAAELEKRGIKLIVVKLPLPNRVLTKLPGEADFTARIQAVLLAHNDELHDFSGVGNDDAFYYDSDHLNRAGITNFIDMYFVDLLKTSRP